MIRARQMAVTHYQVLGERSSGTNFLQRLIGRNTSLERTDELGWKHGFGQMIAVPRDMFVVCMVRNPERWVLSMYNKPWHTTPDMQRLSISDFIRAEWRSAFDKPRYLGRLRRGYVGQPLQQDRHPLTGKPFANIFALRQAKLQYLLSFTARDCNCVFLRLEDAQADPQATMEKMAAALELTSPHAAFRPVKKPQGWRFRTAVGERPTAPDRLSDEDRAYMWSALDQAQEAALGYKP
ncbi:MAG: hypothetical protein AB3N23_09810 [Paracoccaceae bacterium]